VIVTDGRAAPRRGLYEHYPDEDMRRMRFTEQRKAALVGEYAALILLDYPSSEVKAAANRQPVEDLVAILRAAGPRLVYTHNLADRHDTHVAVALRTLTALRGLAAEERPQKLYGCEVWRGLDWLVGEDRVAFDVSANEALQAALLGVYHSQIAGGKRYDLASLGRRRANATFSESHGVDQATGISLAMDLTPLINAPQKEIRPFVQAFVNRLAEDIDDRLRRMD
jgi:LmbE family N-acetylglucosaminyl deacetylase